VDTNDIISALLKETEKEFKDNNLVIANDAHFVSNLSFLSSGSYLINYKLTGNPFKAYPFGRIISLEGPSDSGKTLLASHAIAEVQKIGGIAALFDVERGTVKSRLENLGIDMNKLLISNDKVLEKIFERMIYIIKTVKDKKSDVPLLIILDSLSQASTAHEMEVGFDKVDMSRAKIIRAGLRMINSLISDMNVCFIMVNHQTTKIGGGYRPSHLPPETCVPGGTAVEYFPSMRIETKKGKTYLEGDVPIGIGVNIRVKKTRFAIPFIKTSVDVYFDRGIDPLSGIFDILVGSGVIEKANKTRYSFVDDKETTYFRKDIEEMIKSDPEKYLNLLKDNDIIETATDIVYTDAELEEEAENE